MIGSLGWMELAVIAIIALLVVGPRGLPKLGKSIGKALREFKRESRELRQAIEFEIDEEERQSRVKKASAKKKTKKSGPPESPQPETGTREPSTEAKKSDSK